MKTANGSVEIDLQARGEGPKSDPSTETETTSMLVPGEDVLPISVKGEKRHPRRIGNTYVFCYRHGVPLFTIGPFFIGMNVMVGLLTFTSLIMVVLPVSFSGFFGGICVYLLQLASYTLVFIVNPGLPSKRLSLYDQLSVDRIIDNPYSFTLDHDSEFYCKVCQTVKKRDSFTYHCLDCDVCVEGKYDVARKCRI